MEKIPKPENVESQIEQLLVQLESFARDIYPEMQDQLADEWYDVEMEARVDRDRKQALESLSGFIEKLSRTQRSL